MTTILEPNLTRGPAPESSDRDFGVVFAVVFGLLGCWPLLHRAAPHWWALGVAAAFALAALVRPPLLHPLNRAWLLVGRLLHRVTSLLVMGVIFFLCVTPTGWIMRLLRKDVLSLAPRSDLSSYWIKCAPTPPESMRNQF
jgi:Saxitoxin biosynthesis operon protein SxtJ